MKYKINTKVNTPHGKGIIIGYDLENSRVWRYIIKLKNNPFSYEKVCYFPNEIEKNKR